MASDAKESIRRCVRASIRFAQAKQDRDVEGRRQRDAEYDRNAAEYDRKAAERRAQVDAMMARLGLEGLWNHVRG